MTFLLNPAHGEKDSGGTVESSLVCFELQAQEGVGFEITCSRSKGRICF